MVFHEFRALKPGSVTRDYGKARAGNFFSGQEFLPGHCDPAGLAPYGKVALNVLTDETRLDAITGNAAFSGVEVTVQRAEAQGD